MNITLICCGFSSQSQLRLKELYGVAGADATRLIWLGRPKHAPPQIPSSIRQVIRLEAPFYDCESLLNALEDQIPAQEPCLFDSGFAGSELCGRLAARLRRPVLNGVTELFWENEILFARKMLYSSHMVGTFAVKHTNYLISLSQGLPADPVPQVEWTGETAVFSVPPIGPAPQIQLMEQTQDLSSIRLLVAAGRGVGSKAGVEVLDQCARELGGKLGVSRMVAMNGWAPMDRLIGVSGTIAQSQICIAAGASGAAAFYAGIKKSRYILAINTNPDAPICRSADVVLPGDCLEILPLLCSRVKEK